MGMNIENKGNWGLEIVEYGNYPCLVHKLKRPLVPLCNNDQIYIEEGFASFFSNL